MAELDDFTARLKQELEAAQTKVQSFQVEAEKEYEQRQQRHSQFLDTLRSLQGLAKPRFDKLAEQFQFDLKPSENALGKSADLEFKTPAAHVVLKIGVTHDADIRNVVLTYDLDVLPIYIKFTPHLEQSFPLGQITPESAAKWLDDRLIDFAKVFLQIHFTEQYQRDHQVTDPVADIRFPKFFAHSKLDHDGKTYYFVSADTRREFLARNGLSD